MRVLFFMNHAGFVRNFESTLRELAKRDHEVVVALDRTGDTPYGPRDVQLRRIVDAHPQVSSCATPLRQPTSWSEVGRFLRKGLDYMRYLEPAYVDASKARDRAGSRIPVALVRLAGPRVSRRALRGALTAAERSVPIERRVREFIAGQRPDVVLVTPLVELGSPQVEYMRAARALGIPSVLPVASWDNLTIKGGIHDSPDLVTVWNERQRSEAIELHDVPADRLVVTGAMAYEHWFRWRPRLSREDFCERIGLDPSRAYVLYVGSSRFIAPREGEFILDWARYLRDRSSVQDVQVLVRPHPTNPPERRERIESVGALTVFPPCGADPTDEDSRCDYYDSLYHSAAVVGVNTSAFIEASIVGRPVHTVIERYRDTQLGTLHFRQLLPENRGMLRVARSLDEHAAQLAEALRLGVEAATAHAGPFLESFVRPVGVAKSPTAGFVDAVETTATREPAPWLATRGSGHAQRVAGLALARGVRLALQAREAGLLSDGRVRARTLSLYSPKRPRRRGLS
jgi:hypothetical protein